MAKRGLCLLLALVMAFSLCVPAFAQEDPAEPAAAAVGGMQVEGNSPVGKLIAGEMEARMPTKNAPGDGITNLTVTGNTATVEFSVGSEADVVVAIYDETSGQMLASGTARVPAGATSAAVAIIGRVPDAFMTSAFLLDPSSHEPLCDDYSSSLYTSDMQEFLTTDINDYDPDRVVDLDGDPSTNFMVYGEETMVAEAVGAANVLTDNGNGTYTVTGADSSFTSLQPGDVFTYEYADGTVLPVKVASVAVSGTTVTVTEDPNITLDDVFDVIRIDFDGEAEEGAAPTALDYTGKASVKFSFDTELGDYGSIAGSCSANFKMKLYKTWTSKYIELTADYSMTGSFKIKGEGEKKVFPLKNAFALHPLPAVTIRLTPSLILQPKGSLEFSATIKGTLGIAIDGNKTIDKSKPIEFEPSIKMEGSVFAGLSLEPQLVVVHEKIAEVSLTAQIGCEIKATYDMVEKSSVKHDCLNCIDGDVNAKAEASAKVKVAGCWKLEWKFFELSRKLMDFYYCQDHGGFHIGTCPYISYRVRLTVKDTRGGPLEGASVKNTGLAIEPVTDAKGLATFYLPNGSYQLTVVDKDDTTSQALTLKVENTTRDVDVVLKIAPPATEAPSPTPDYGSGSGSGDADVMSSGYCGKDGANLKWTLYEDGTLVIAGKGDMERYSSAIAVPWDRKSVNNVVIQSGVTSISSNAFAYCGMTSVVVPASVTKIGESAFSNCKSLTSVTLPDNMTVLEGWTFEKCASLTEVKFPSSLTRIENQAFSNCTSLTEVNLPEGLTDIEHSAFVSCTGLTTITIPATVTNMNKGAFSGCGNLKEINVAAGNPAYSSVEGLLLDAAGTTLIWCPEGRTACTIPNCVTKIGESAFVGCKDLVSVTIPGSVISVEAYAFSSCAKLTNVTIQNGVTSIGSGAFSGCSSLSEIELPASVAKVGSGLFEDCAMQKITILNPRCELPDGFVGFNTNTEFYGYEGSTTQAYVNSGSTFWLGWKFVSLGPAPADTVTTGDGEAEPAATPEPTAEPEITPEPEVTAEPEMPELPVDTGFAPLDASQEQSESDIVPAAAFTGTSDNQTALFTGLKPEADYAVLVVVNASAAELLAADNLLFIAQAEADSSGNIALAYAPRLNSAAQVRAYGPEPESRFPAPTVTISSVSNGIQVSWNKIDGAPRYMVYYNENGGAWKKIGTTDKTTYTRAAKYLKSGVTYRFTVRCCDNDKQTLLGPYEASNSLKYTQLAAPTVKIAQTSAGIKVTWNKIDGSPRYMVYYKENGGGWKKIGTTTATSYTRKASALKNGATYAFTVRCCANDKKTLLGPYTASNSLKFIQLAAPTVKIAKVAGGIKVSWNKVAGSPRYMVYYKENNGGWKKIGTTTATSYTRAAKYLKNGATYAFTVRCCANDKTTVLSPYKASNSLQYKK